MLNREVKASRATQPRLSSNGVSQSSLSEQTENTFLVEIDFNHDIEDVIREEIESRYHGSAMNKSYMFPRQKAVAYKLPLITQRHQPQKKSFTIVRTSNYFGAGILTSEKLRTGRSPSPRGILLGKATSKTPPPNKLLARLAPISRTPDKMHFRSTELHSESRLSASQSPTRLTMKGRSLNRDLRLKR